MHTTDIDIVEVAAELALRAHIDHINHHNGEPYVCHLYRVARAAELDGCVPEIVAAAWLHDSIEDGKLTYTEILSATTFNIAQIVLDVSKVKGEDNETYYRRLQGRPQAAKLKTYDLKDNFRRNHLIEDDAKRLRMAGKYSLGMDMLRRFM